MVENNTEIEHPMLVTESYHTLTHSVLHDERSNRMTGVSSSKLVNHVQRNNIDCGRAWLVMAASWCGLILTAGIVATVGIFHVYMLDAFEDDPTIVASVGALFSGLCALSGPLASAICNKSSCRVCMFIGGILSALGLAVSSYVTTLGMMFVSFGLIAGVGLGLAYIPAMVIIGYYFEKRRNLAAGIAVTGVPMGIIILPPIFQWIEATYGWRGTLLISGGLCFNLCVCAMIMQPSVLEKQTQASRTRNMYTEPKSQTVVSCLSRLAASICEDIREVVLLFLNTSFVFVCLSNTLRNTSGSIVYLHFPNFVLEKGNTPSDVSRLFLAMGIGSIIGRLLTGIGTNSKGIGTKSKGIGTNSKGIGTNSKGIGTNSKGIGTNSKGIGTNSKQSDRGLDMFVISFGSIGILSIATCLLPVYSSSTLGLLIYAFIFGFYYGVVPALYSPLIVTVVGLRHQSTAYAVLMLATGIGYIVGPPLASWFKDITESYELQFVLSGGIFLVSSLAFLGVPGRFDNSTPQENTDTDKTYQNEQNGSDMMRDKLNNDNKTLQTGYKRETIDQMEVEVFLPDQCVSTDNSIDNHK